MSTSIGESLDWAMMLRVSEDTEVSSVSCGRATMCLTRVAGRLWALGAVRARISAKSPRIQGEIQLVFGQ